jgi:hypothetical protein
MRPDPLSTRQAFGLGLVAQPSNPTVFWSTAANLRADSGREPLPCTDSG